MADVYFMKVTPGSDPGALRSSVEKLLLTAIESENISLCNEVPLKVHFGEKGNSSFVRPEYYDGIIDLLEKRTIKSCFIETSSMYGGARFNRELHTKTAIDHGFVRLPIVIADGEQGEAFSEIAVNQKHFKTCKVGSAFFEYDQFIVVSHFKGHMLAGFGGAMKQLSMGFASKGGKIAMHIGMKPRMVSRKCKKCNLCKKRCNENAITIGKKSFIDQQKCVGCGACVAACPNKAVTLFTARTLLSAIGGGTGKPFREKVAEYALAAATGKRNIYINYLMNITAGCDCEPKKMKNLMEDIGILISTDPVSADKASYDLVRQKGKKFKGDNIFAYAEKIGLGSASYTLKEIEIG